MYSKSDSVFGKLERHGQTWVGSYWFDVLEKDIEINLDYSDENSPSKQERESFLSFKAQIDKIFLAIQKALFHFLIENTEHYRQQHDIEDQEIVVPEIKNIAEIWESLEIIRIEIDSHNYQNTCITMICDFKWDAEHGLDIDFYNNQIGISGGGVHWDDKAHYDSDGNPN